MHLQSSTLHGFKVQAQLALQFVFVHLFAQQLHFFVSLQSQFSHLQPLALQFELVQLESICFFLFIFCLKILVYVFESSVFIQHCLEIKTFIIGAVRKIQV